MAESTMTLDDIRDRLSGQRSAMVTTVDEAGTLSSRPLAVQQIDAGGDVWFIVNRRAEWVGPADGAPINVAIVDDGDTWASFAGRASLIDDPEAIAELRNGKSSSRFDDDAQPVALLARTEQIEWWASRSTVAQLVELGKAKLTGERPDLGGSGTIDI